MGYSFQLAVLVLLYALSNRQDSTDHGLCCTSRGALAGMRNSSMGPQWRNDLMSYRTMSEHSYQSYLSLLLFWWASKYMFICKIPHIGFYIPQPLFTSIVEQEIAQWIFQVGLIQRSTMPNTLPLSYVLLPLHIASGNCDSVFQTAITPRSNGVFSLSHSMLIQWPTTPWENTLPLSYVLLPLHIATGNCDSVFQTAITPRSNGVFSLSHSMLIQWPTTPWENTLPLSYILLPLHIATGNCDSVFQTAITPRSNGVFSLSHSIQCLHSKWGINN